MTSPRPSLAGTPFAYRHCQRCRHGWIRHSFGPAPACSDGGYTYTDDYGNKTPMTYRKCDCPGWQEPGTQEAGKDPAMTTTTEPTTAHATVRPWALAHSALSKLAAAHQCAVDGDHHGATYMMENAINDLARVEQAARRALAHLHLHHGTAQPATTAPAGPAPLQPITTPAIPAADGDTQ